jgi:hypothetical protein
LNTIRCPDGKVVDVGIDYLTLTYSTKEPHFNDFWQLSREFLLQELEADEELKPCSNGFYQGFRGKHFFTGDNGHGAIIEVSGKLADRTANVFFWKDWKPKCTRLDAQVTVQYEEEADAHGARLRRAIRKFEMGIEAGERQAITHFEDRTRDTGITSGVRGNTRYFRAYHAASGGHEHLDGNHWRYELELRKDHANEAWRMYLGSGMTGPLSRSLVQSELMRWDIALPWMENTECPKLAPHREKTTNERRMQWIDFSCSPALKQCLSDPVTRSDALQWLERMQEIALDVGTSKPLKAVGG